MPREIERDLKIDPQLPTPVSLMRQLRELLCQIAAFRDPAKDSMSPRSSISFDQPNTRPPPGRRTGLFGINGGDGNSNNSGSSLFTALLQALTQAVSQSKGATSDASTAATPPQTRSDRGRAEATPATAAASTASATRVSPHPRAQPRTPSAANAANAASAANANTANAREFHSGSNLAQDLQAFLHDLFHALKQVSQSDHRRRRRFESSTMACVAIGIADTGGSGARDNDLRRGDAGDPNGRRCGSGHDDPGHGRTGHGGKRHGRRARRRASTSPSSARQLLAVR